MNFPTVDPSPVTQITGSDIPLLTTTSNDALDNPTPVKGILKKPWEGHTISAINSGTRTKKKLSWNPTVKEGSHLSPRKTIPNPIPVNTITRGNNRIIFLSQSIEKWAADIAGQKASELQDLEDTLDNIKKNPTSPLLKIQKQLEECYTTIKEQVTSAKKYALWTAYRTKLLKGDTQLQTSLEAKQKNISTEWTFEQLYSDWDLAKEEPWAQGNLEYLNLKETMVQLTAKHEEMKEAKEKILSLAQDIKEAEKKALLKKTPNSQTAITTSTDSPEESFIKVEEDTNAYEGNKIQIPNGKEVDPKKDDIGSVEHHEDGTYTIFDMRGTRYDYPHPTPSNDSSCIIS